MLPQCMIPNKAFCLTSTKISKWASLLLILSSSSWATFSIVAVDTLTKEVGSAGASCVDAPGGVLVISKLIPGKGGINTQAAYDPTNQTNASNRMVAGDSPQQIMTWLSQNDVARDPSERQYGAVDLYQSSARAAAYTGTNTPNSTGSRVGVHYSVQGNTLKNQGILDSIQARFLRTPGSLAVKLMSALQGANTPGADSRCLQSGVSSKTSFIQVARSTDAANAPYLRLAMERWKVGKEPIDSLQKLFDKWKSTLPLQERKTTNTTSFHIVQKVGGITIALNLDHSQTRLSRDVSIQIRELNGETVYSQSLSFYTTDLFVPLSPSFQPGMHFLQIRVGEQRLIQKVFLF